MAMARRPGSGLYGLGRVGAMASQFDRQNRKFIRYRHDSTNPESLGENDLHVLFWMRRKYLGGPAHDGAQPVCHQAPLFEKFKHEPGNPNSLSGTMMNGIYEDRQGILWISAINRAQPRRPQTGQFTFYLTAGPEAIRIRLR